MSTKPPAGHPMAQLLRQGPFARYMAGEAVSMTGTWMQVMAQSWVMTTLTSSAMMLGLINFASGIPMVLLSMWGGACADHYSKRNILVITQVVQITLALIIGRLVAIGEVQIWHLVTVAVVLGISNSFEMPAAAALVPELASRKHLAQAIAIDRAVFHGTRLVGPALAGYIIGLWGTAAAFYLNAFSFVPLILALASVPRSMTEPHPHSDQERGIRPGWMHVRSDRPTMAMIGLMASTTVFVFPVMVVMLPLYAAKALLLGPDKMGLLMAIASIGSLTGSIGLLAVPRTKRRAFLITASLGTVCAMAGLASAHSFGFSAACLVMQSLCVSSLIGLANTIVQERAPSHIRGRVSAVAGLSFFGLMPFASLGLTGFADYVGMRSALFIAAGCYLAATMTIFSLPQEPDDSAASDRNASV